MRSGRALALVVFVVLVPLAESVAQVVETEEGPVEFIGLRHWTVQQVRDTLAAIEPDISLASAACAVTLREAGFPQAAVTRHFGEAGHGEPYTTIVVVEPGAAGGVRYASRPPDSLPPAPAWQDARSFFPRGRGALSRAVYDHVFGFDGSGRDSLVHRARAFLEAHRTGEDRALALETLRRDRNPGNRFLAAAVLASFMEEDAAWWALVRAARGYEPDDLTTGMATTVLNAMRQEARRTIDWAPAADDLRAILDGTNPWFVQETMEMLTRTGVSRDLAPALLGGGGEMVLEHLEARHPLSREAAREFLVRLSGDDLGDDSAAWRAWIATLEEASSIDQLIEGSRGPGSRR